MKNILNKALRITAFVLIAVVIFSILSAVCERKTYIGEWNYMSKVNEFYSMEENTLDYVCVGSSHMYCTINPLEVWKQTGAAGFVLATQQQPLVASYHYIKEAFKTQSPKYVILEGYMIIGESNYDSAVLYDAIDPLKPSFNKFQMINNLVEYDNRPDYYFNVLKYHTRWNTVPANEIETVFDEHIDTYKGFVALNGKFTGENLIPDYENTKDIELSSFNIEALNNIYDLVTENSAELIIMFGPYNAKMTNLTEKVKAEIKWAKEKNITVLDYCSMLDELGVDPECDYYDGDHLDISGALKTSAHFAAYLSDKGVGENTLIDKDKWQADYDAYVKKAGAELE